MVVVLAVDGMVDWLAGAAVVAGGVVVASVHEEVAVNAPSSPVSHPEVWSEPLRYSWSAPIGGGEGRKEGMLEGGRGCG